MFLLEQDDGAARLDVEGTRGVQNGMPNDLYDLLIGDRRFVFQSRDGAACFGSGKE